MSVAAYKWKTITDEFKEACSVLKTGELYKDPNFGLFEAMSAIEMMDPKMDAGLLINQSKSKIKTVDEAIKNDLIKLKDIELDEKLAIMDNTLCNLLTWIDGTSLAQTVFTNLYLHVPDLIEDKTLKWFSIAVLKLVESIRSKILAAAVFEEEDFQSMHYNFKFAPDVTEQACVAALKTVEDEAAKFYRNAKNNQQQNDSEKAKLQVELANGVLARIKFTRLLLQLLQLTNENLENSSEEISKYCNQAREALKTIQLTHDLGIKPSYVENGKTKYPVVMGFEPSINQRLLPPTFPRYIHIHSFESTFNELNRFINQVDSTLQLHKMNNFYQIFDFMLKFGDEKPSVIARSVLQLIKFSKLASTAARVNAFDDSSKFTQAKILFMKDLLKDTVKQFIEPPVLQQKCFLYNNPICKQLVDVFLTKCSPVFVTLLQILGNNRARQREKFGHVLEEFIVLQEEADNIDRILHSLLLQQRSPQAHVACFGSWVLNNSLNMMILYLLFGFELELYSRYEYHCIYWYLSEILLNWQITTLNRVDNYLQQAEAVSGAKPSTKKSNKKKSKSFYDKEITLLYAHRHMFGAYYQAMKAFKLEGQIQEPNEDFNDEELRYQHRFRAFEVFTTPPLCYYRQFKEKDVQFEKTFQLEKMYASAQQHFEEAKKNYEELADWNSSLTFSKIAKTNFVVMRLLASGLKKIQNLEFDFSVHPHFPIIRI